MKKTQVPLGECFDIVDDKGDDRFGMESYEKSESQMQKLAFDAAVAKCNASEDEIEVIFSGDLLNQCVSSGYAGVSYQIPILGLFGACSTAAEGLLMAAVFASTYG